MDAIRIRNAILNGTLADLPNSRCAIVTSDAELFPLSAVEWRILTPERSNLVLDRTLMISDRLDFFSTRIAYTMQLLEDVQCLASISQAALMLNLSDNPVTRGLTYCSARRDDLLIPDTTFIKTHGQCEMRERWARDQLPWEERLPVIFWRGSTTGRWPGGNWRELPRLILCRLAAKNPEIFDIGIAKVGQLPDGAKEEIYAEGLLRPFIPSKLLNLYRYHVDIDGNTNAWEGLFLKLLTGSPVIKVESPLGFRQWYYDRLVPWENYVPVGADMADLTEKAIWLISHNNEARQIGRAGRALAESMLYENEIALTAEKIAAAVAEERFSITGG